MTNLRERLSKGDPGAWASAEAPLLLLSGGLPAQQAQAGAIACLEAGGQRTALLDGLAQAWWQEQASPGAMCDLLGRLGERAGAGSYEHRCAVLVACLCARTTLAHAGPRQGAVEECLAQLERWAWGDGGVDPESVHRCVRVFAQASLDEAGYTVAATAAIEAIDCAAWSAVAAARASGARFAASRTTVAVFTHAATEEEAEAATASHEQRLADLIRAALPCCPLLQAAV